MSATELFQLVSPGAGETAPSGSTRHGHSSLSQPGGGAARPAGSPAVLMAYPADLCTGEVTTLTSVRATVDETIKLGEQSPILFDAGNIKEGIRG